MGYENIKIDEHFTSYKFYHSLLPKLHVYARKPEQKEIVFDFTEAKTISPLVIPNLLCLGFIINENYHYIPQIYVPDNKDSDNVRAYLHDIDFVDIARKYGLFSFTPSIDYGEKRKMVGEESLTHEFSLQLDEERAKNELSRYFGAFFKEHLQDFEYPSPPENGDMLPSTYNAYNMVEDVCGELIVNSLSHGHSFAIMTAQANYSKKTIYISIADCGIGFKNSINQQIEQRVEPFEQRTERMSDELEAITSAIFVRAEEENNKVYGLYPLIKRVLFAGGIMRIHSINTQLILTDKMLTRLMVASSRKTHVEAARRSFLDSIREPQMTAYNVYTNLKCGGTHIEIELPMKREG